MDFSWSFHLWKKSVFSMVINSLIFSQAFRVKLCFICDSSLLIMSAKDRNQKFSAIFEKSNVNILLCYFFEQRAFKHIFAFVLLQMCACLKEQMRVNCVFCALCMVCPGSADSWNRQGCNRQSMQRVEDTWSIGTGLFLNAQTQMQFSKQPFSWFWS